MLHFIHCDAFFAPSSIDLKAQGVMNNAGKAVLVH